MSFLSQENKSINEFYNEVSFPLFLILKKIYRFGIGRSEDRQNL